MIPTPEDTKIYAYYLSQKGSTQELYLNYAVTKFGVATVSGRREAALFLAPFINRERIPSLRRSFLIKAATALGISSEMLVGLGEAFQKVAL